MQTSKPIIHDMIVGKILYIHEPNNKLGITLTLLQNHKTETSNLDHPHKPCLLFPSKPGQTVGLK